MCMFVDLQVGGKYSLRRKIGSSILYRPLCGALLLVVFVLHHFAFQFKTSVLNVCVCGLAS
jgi:hypothetical protein